MKIMGSGPFTSVAVLKRVGVSASTIGKIGPSVTVSPAQQHRGSPGRPHRTGSGVVSERDSPLHPRPRKAAAMVRSGPIWILKSTLPG